MFLRQIENPSLPASFFLQVIVHMHVYVYVRPRLPAHSFCRISHFYAFHASCRESLLYSHRPKVRFICLYPIYPSIPLSSLPVPVPQSFDLRLGSLDSLLDLI